MSNRFLFSFFFSPLSFDGAVELGEEVHFLHSTTLCLLLTFSTYTLFFLKQCNWYLLQGKVWVIKAEFALHEHFPTYQQTSNPLNNLCCHPIPWLVLVVQPRKQEPSVSLHPLPKEFPLVPLPGRLGQTLFLSTAFLCETLRTFSLFLLVILVTVHLAGNSLKLGTLFHAKHSA